jgi:hypothetical protein
MNDPLQTIFQQARLKTTAFPTSSRYYNIDTAALEKPGHEPVVFLKRRFVPRAERFSLLTEHSLTQGERLDNITSRYYGDPEQFWRICDSNNVLFPNELTEISGSRIKITLPEGIPGTTNA